MNQLVTRDLLAEEAHIASVLASDRFLSMEGLGGEIPFYIWAHPPNQQLEADQAIKRVTNQLQTKHGLHVLTIDLYELAIELLTSRGILEQIFEIEPEWKKSEFINDIQGMLNPESHLAPAIADRVKSAGDYDLLIITGVGKVFPFIRSHNILNNIQVGASEKPMLLLFPGEYRQSRSFGSALVLFGLLQDDQHYRAKNILEQEP
jgi:hypothetical protein